MTTIQTNLAFIDGQNLHLGTRSGGRTIDFVKLRIYLTEQLNVSEAYYFLGVIDAEEQELYTMLQKAGFIVIFREHNSSMTGDKKGNIDTDLVFEVLRCMIDRQDRDQVVLVSGDGDYIKLVKYLIKHKRMGKIVFPNTHHSSLYNQLDEQYIVDLSDKEVKSQIRLGGPTSKKTKSSPDTTLAEQIVATTQPTKAEQNTKKSPEKPNPQAATPASSVSDTEVKPKSKSRRRRSSRKPKSTPTVSS